MEVYKSRGAANLLPKKEGRKHINEKVKRDGEENRHTSRGRKRDKKENLSAGTLAHHTKFCKAKHFTPIPGSAWYKTGRSRPLRRTN